MKPVEQFKIFVVDDDFFFQNLFRQHLENLGYKDVTLYSSGFDCLNHLYDKPDVIFLDYNMDNLSGYEVLKKIKRFNPDIYVVMVSAQEEIKPAIDALKHGAFDYIQKGNDELTKVRQVLVKIAEVKDLLERSRPTLLKKVFQFF
jgi:DNA-binding NtrC family response regulator